jgi:hypothetical protein
MKNVLRFIVFAVVFAFIGFFSVSHVMAYGEQESGSSRNASASRQNASASANTVPVPVVTHFNERNTISKWVGTWDRPNIPCYVYIFSYGNCIGYFISNGKPAATTSYLTPEYIEEYYSFGSGGIKNVQMPDVDGTYGTNNPGIRFFTAAGAAVEASGFQYIYSDVKLELNVPEFKFQR